MNHREHRELKERHRALNIKLCAPLYILLCDPLWLLYSITKINNKYQKL
jgi:hypothetical protein